MTNRSQANRPPKNITLHHNSIAFIEQYAKQHQLTFSHAIEQLALVGLQDTRAVGTAQLSAHLVDVVIKERMNRLTRILVHNTAQTAEANDMLDAIYKLQLIQLQHLLNKPVLDDLLRLNPDKPADLFVIETHRARRLSAAQRTRQRLKGLVAKAEALITGILDSADVG